MKNQQPWVPPLSHLPLSLKPIVAMQKKHYGDVLNPTRWWGRMPRLFWLVALFVGYLERKKARLESHCWETRVINKARSTGSRRAFLRSR